MIDQPDAAELLGAMADTLTNDVLPELDGAPQHSARVVANLCRILSREIADESSPTSLAALAALLESDGTLDDLVALLDARLATSDATFDAAAHQVLLDDATRRLRIAKPTYVEGE